jgi:hypothetical protein
MIEKNYSINKLIFGCPNFRLQYRLKNMPFRIMRCDLSKGNVFNNLQKVDIKDLLSRGHP